MSQEIKEAREIIERLLIKHRRTHTNWLRYLTRHPEKETEHIASAGGIRDHKEAIADYDEALKALAKLRTEPEPCGTCICMDCGKVIKVAEQSNHLKECPKEKSNCQEPKPVLPPVTGKRKQGHSQLKYDPKLKAIISIDPHPDCQAPEQPPAGDFGEFMEDVKDEIRKAPKMFHQLQKRDELIRELQADLDRSEASRKELLFACGFAKAHIKKGSQKKALPILRAAIAKEKEVKI